MAVQSQGNIVRVADEESVGKVADNIKYTTLRLTGHEGFVRNTTLSSSRPETAERQPTVSSVVDLAVNPVINAELSVSLMHTFGESCFASKWNGYLPIPIIYKSGNICTLASALPYVLPEAYLIQISYGTKNDILYKMGKKHAPGATEIEIISPSAITAIKKGKATIQVVGIQIPANSTWVGNGGFSGGDWNIYLKKGQMVYVDNAKHSGGVLNGFARVLRPGLNFLDIDYADFDTNQNIGSFTAPFNIYFSNFIQTGKSSDDSYVKKTQRFELEQVGFEDTDLVGKPSYSYVKGAMAKSFTLTSPLDEVATMQVSYEAVDATSPSDTRSPTGASTQHIDKWSPFSTRTEMVTFRMDDSMGNPISRGLRSFSLTYNNNALPAKRQASLVAGDINYGKDIEITGTLEIIYEKAKIMRDAQVNKDFALTLFYANKDGGIIINLPSVRLSDLNTNRDDPTTYLSASISPHMDNPLKSAMLVSKFAYLPNSAITPND